MDWGVSARRLGTWWRRMSDRWFVWSGVNFSIAFKLLVPMAAVTVAVAAAMAVIVISQIQAQIHQAYAEHAADVAVGVTAMFMAHPDDTAQLDDYLKRVAAGDPGVQAIEILDTNPGTTVLASSSASDVGQNEPLNDAQTYAVRFGRVYQVHEGIYGRGTWVTFWPIQEKNILYGAVMLTVSDANETNSVNGVETTIGVAAFASVLVESALIFGVFYFSIWRRTRRMQRAIAAVARGDFTTRLPEGQEPPGRDEVFNLARSVDLMIGDLDERMRGETLIRDLTRKVLEGAASETLIGDALRATKEALGLESCVFATLTEQGALTSWIDHENVVHDGHQLPIWEFGLTRVAVEARRTVVTDRFGERGRFADEQGDSELQAVVVPLPRLTKAGNAIIAVAPIGETIHEGGLAVLAAVAATISESLHMHAAEEARAESAVKSKVMAAVSHEMRNPLNAILGFTGLVLGPTGTNLTDKQRRQLTHVQTSANTMLTLVNNYLDLAKVRSGAFTIQAQTVKLPELIAETEALMQPMAAAKAISLRTSVAAESDVRVDAVRLRQVLTNLISNAIKFTPAGGRVVIRARAARGVCRIAVSDNGVGIPEDQKHLVFTEFAKIDAGTMAQGKGSGLGLALTKAFVSAMNGAIKFYSRRGRGTTFVVTLPVQAAEKASAA